MVVERWPRWGGRFVGLVPLGCGRDERWPFMVDYKQVLRLRGEGVSQRGIADVLGCSRNTVAAVVTAAVVAGIGYEQVLGPPSPWPARLLCELQPGHEHQGKEDDRQADPSLTPQPPKWDEPVRPRRGHQSSGARLDQLLRSLLPLRAVSRGTAHRRASRQMGYAKVQATTR